MRKATKQEARYGHGMKNSHCSLCDHYLENGRCSRVQGIVSPQGWCKFFHRALIHDTDADWMKQTG